jgi:hypothetical protein
MSVVLPALYARFAGRASTKSGSPAKLAAQRAAELEVDELLRAEVERLLTVGGASGADDISAGLPEGRPEALDHRVHEIGDNVLGMIEFDPCEEARIARDIGDVFGGAHLPKLAGLAFIPLQVLIAVVSPLAGMLCRRLGRRMPLFAGGAVVALGCALTLRVGSNATYWADLPSHPLAVGGHGPGDRVVDDPRPHLRRVRSRRIGRGDVFSKGRDFGV